MKKILIWVAVTGFLFGCDKPNPTRIGINADKTSIRQNETARLSAEGDFDHLEWTLPDGQTRTSTSVNFSSLTTGEFDVYVKGFSRKEKFSDEASVRIVVTESVAPPPPADGQVMVWTADPDLMGVQIYFDGVYAGMLTGYYPGGIGSNPCGSAYCVTQTLSSGEHVLTASIGSYSNNFPVTVTSKQCLKFNLY